MELMATQARLRGVPGDRPEIGEPVAEMHAALGEARFDPEQSGHACRVPAASIRPVAQHHVAPAFAMHGPRFGEGASGLAEALIGREPTRMQFRIAAGQPADVGTGIRASSASGENGRISAPAARQPSSICG